MSYWVDFNMLMSEIQFHRSNVQRRIKAYKEIENPTEWEKLECKENVGKEEILMCLQAWCNGFKFSIEEMKELEDVKKELIGT